MIFCCAVIELNYTTYFTVYQKRMHLCDPQLSVTSDKDMQCSFAVISRHDTQLFYRYKLFFRVFL
jgi:hypothetical protein